jgi:adenosine deaminase
MQVKAGRFSVGVPKGHARGWGKAYAPVDSDELPFCGVSLADIRVLPKVDLHRHLVGAIRPEVLVRTARKLAVKLNIGENVDDVRAKMVLRTPGVCDYSTFLRKRIWGEFKNILRSELGCANAVYWAVADAHADGLAYVEFRVAPYGIGPSESLTFEQFVAGLRRGVRVAKRDFGSTNVRFILSLGRRAVYERWPSALRSRLFTETAKAASTNPDIIVGLDLSGDEDKYPNRSFIEFANIAKDLNVPLTVHAGETGRPESIWEAVDLLNAARIGHGIAAHKDKALMQKLAESNIPVEVCFTSNYLLGVVAPDSEHPFRALNEAGVCVTVNTDDPILFNETTLSLEYYGLIRANMITISDLPKLLERSAEASFLIGPEKTALIRRVRQSADIAQLPVSLMHNPLKASV